MYFIKVISTWFFLFNISSLFFSRELLRVYVWQNKNKNFKICRSHDFFRVRVMHPAHFHYFNFLTATFRRVSSFIQATNYQPPKLSKLSKLDNGHPPFISCLVPFEIFLFLPWALWPSLAGLTYRTSIVGPLWAWDLRARVEGTGFGLDPEGRGRFMHFLLISAIWKIRANSKTLILGNCILWPTIS